MTSQQEREIKDQFEWNRLKKVEIYLNKKPTQLKWEGMKKAR